jgi:perosamine synthetase
LSLNPEPSGTINGAWMPTVVFDQELNITRELVMAAFRLENIDARVFFWPLSSLPSFEPAPHNTIAWDIPERAINLPSYHDITAEEMERVVGTLNAITMES